MKNYETVNAIIQKTIKRLSKQYTSEVATQNAWWLLEALTHKKRAYLLTNESIHITTEQQAQLTQWLDDHLVHHKPIQYIIGWVPFLDLTITTRSPTLIPRPETEEWCANTIELLKQANIQQFTLLDLCTGSGCVALAFASAFPQAHIYASDIKHNAIALTQENAQKNNIHNITIIQSDLFKAFKDKTFDIIVGNPPYIDEERWKTLEPNVRDWEDKQALVAPKQGYALIESIINQAPHYTHINQKIHKHNIPTLILEISSRQSDSVSAYMKEHGYTNVQIWKDLAGKERVVCGSITNAVDTTTYK